MNSKSNIKAIILFIVALVFIAGVGIFGYMALQGRDDPNEIDTIIEPEDEDVEEPAEEEVVREDTQEDEEKVDIQEDTANNQPFPLNVKTGDENYPIEVWGLTGQYAGQYASSYKISRASSGYQYLEFFSSSLPENLADKAIGTIYRLTGDIKVGDIFSDVTEANKNRTVADFYKNNGMNDLSSNWHIGDYYYIYKPATDASDPISKQILIDIKSYFSTLVAL